MSFFDIFKINEFKAEIEKLRAELQQANETNSTLNTQINSLNAKINNLGLSTYEEVQQAVAIKKKELQNVKDEMESLNPKREAVLKNFNDFVEDICEKKKQQTQELESIEDKVKTATNRLSRARELYKSVDHAIKKFFNFDPLDNAFRLPVPDLIDLDRLSPRASIKLNCMDVKSLRKAFKENEKLIEKTFSQYSERYRTVEHQIIYDLMAISLRLEYQNILTELEYEKLDTATEKVKQLTNKYTSLLLKAGKHITGSYPKLLGELEYLFIEGVKIEYNWYVKKEQSKQEQLALRQKMKEEAEERKLLKQQQAKIEKEETKYNNEIDKLQKQLDDTTNNSELELLKARIAELQNKLMEVEQQKDEIVRLQNGKAGYVYIISNLGSFGNDVFKVGMTRRLDPQDRIDELGSASVPFRFDVHSFIFSQNAVELETNLHHILDANRVNKVNLRKEFFKISIDELEEIVYSIDPTASFTKTMVATEFRQSISTTENYTSELSYSDEYDDDDDE